MVLCCIDIVFIISERVGIFGHITVVIEEW
jgi:hypothetical protein